MTPYLWRLCCLSLASAFVVQLSCGLLMRVFARGLAIWAGRFDPARGASIVLALRWLPGALGVFVAGCLCVPSYLRLEPDASEEEVGLVCLGLASLALFSYVIPVTRASVRAVRSELRLKALLSGAEEDCADGITIIREPSPAMALVGLFRARVVVSRDVVGLLNLEQMDAALRHERAHSMSGDNWKRVVLELAPLDGSGGKLRAAWTRFTEWAADDRAAAGDSARSVALASALVSVARLSHQCATVPVLPLQASLLVSEGTDLRVRIERLLDPGPSEARLRFPAATVLAMCATGAIGVVALAQQAAIAAVLHGLLESLMG